MDALVIDNEASAVHEAQTNFFSRQPIDNRFVSSDLHAYYPTTAIEGTNLSFHLPAWKSPSFYDLSQIIMRVELRLCTKSSQTLPPTCNVTVVNNLLHSLFETCVLTLGDTRITQQNDNYAKRAYLTNLVSCSGQAKNTWLQSSMWLQDEENMYDSFVVEDDVYKNPGFTDRQYMFKHKTTGQWLDGPIPLAGRVMHDMWNCRQGLVPGIGVRLSFVKAPQKFILMSDDPNVDAELKIVKATLFCRVATMAEPLYRQIVTKMAKNPVVMEFRQTQLYSKDIPANTLHFYDNNIVPAGSPCRIMFVTLPTVSNEGTLEKNPFSYRKSWPPPVSSNIARRKCNLHRLRKRDIKRLQEQEDEQDAEYFDALEVFEREYETYRRKYGSSGDGPSARTRKNRRRKQRRQMARSSDSSEPDSPPPAAAIAGSSEGPPPLPTSPPRPPVKPVRPAPLVPTCGGCDLADVNDVLPYWITKFNLTLNGRALDEFVDSEMGQYECMTSFYRFNEYMNLIGGIFDNDIDYSLFQTDAYINIFDLSSSANSQLNGLCPQIRRGQLAVDMAFNRPTNEAHTLLCLIEYYSILEVDSRLRLSLRTL